MARVADAYECDKCSKLVRASEITKIKTAFKGRINGSFEREFCDECVDDEVPEGIELTPPKSSTGEKGQQEDPEPK